MEGKVILTAVQKICSELDWQSKVQIVKEHHLVICPIKNDEIFIGVLFVISANPQKVNFYINFRKRVNEQKHYQMGEALHRINSKMLSGCFELDFECHEIRFRDYILFPQSKNLNSNIKELVANALKVSIFHCSIIDLINSGLGPTEAIDALIKV